MADRNRQWRIERIAAEDSTVVLRPWKPGDASTLAHCANNPRIAATMRDLFPSPYTPDDANRFIALLASDRLILPTPPCR